MSVLNNPEFPSFLQQLYFVKITLVWPSRWNYTKVLYILNRYSPFVDTALALQCLQEAIPKRFILLVRTYALWNCNKYILVMLSAIFANAVDADAAIMRYEGCVPINAQGLWFNFLLNMIIEFVVIALTLLRRFVSAFSTRTHSPMLKVLYRDGILFYLAMLAMSIMNICLILTAPPAISPMMQIPLRVVYSTLCSRALLNLRKAAHKLDTFTGPHSTVHFTTRSRIGFEDVDLQWTQDSGSSERAGYSTPLA
ncbi:hypothetical protein CERSUDRAFT_67843 [Gelatoporia subvermispora B]|uniref:DUF6533 domain-containing protein n=1 Tax=Ceriporiopsis subvermispora (strain B) TaxID=914234 RepID=M2R434_CERS8|nr:hypothetical protein CERSUDRAFT_67843 [Gelatoporia subvermispora B]